MKIMISFQATQNNLLEVMVFRFSRPIYKFVYKEEGTFIYGVLGNASCHFLQEVFLNT